MSRGNSSNFDLPHSTAPTPAGPALNQTHLCFSCRWLELTGRQAGRQAGREAERLFKHNAAARETMDRQVGTWTNNL